MSTRIPVTAAKAAFCMFDVEALSDAFTLAAYDVKHHAVELFYLVEPGGHLAREIDADPEAFTALVAGTLFERNPALRRDRDGVKARFLLYDLRTLAANERLAHLLGMFDGEKVCSPGGDDTFDGKYRLITDVEDEHDPFDRHPYLGSYNGYNYDTTIMAVYFMEAFATLRSDAKKRREGSDQPLEGFVPTSPQVMRRHNDAMFSDQHIAFMPSYLTDGAVSGGAGWNSLPSKLRGSMLNSGRHIDIARLNELQQKVGLKRLLGGLGRQILESEKLSHDSKIENILELAELLAYNTSDVVGLEFLRRDKVYSGGFDLKTALMYEYPETVFDKGPDGKVHISRDNVRMGRLTPDSTSAKFVARILAPYKNLSDIEAVSFLYPSQRIVDEAAARGEVIERRNVLDDCEAFFKAVVPDTTKIGRAARAQLETVFAYYRRIEGSNFNTSDQYLKDYPNTEAPTYDSLNQIPKSANNVPYFEKDGTPTSCFATFSIGGIHGAEYSVAAYESVCREIDEFNAVMAEIRGRFPEPADFWAEHPGKKTYLARNGKEYTRAQVLTAKTTLKALKAKGEARELLKAQIASIVPGPDAADRAEALEESFNTEWEHVGYRPDRERPSLFEKKKSDDSTKLKQAFVHTSLGLAIHEDFSSYYPNLLRNMSAFYNEELGADRYAKIFEEKELYGKKMKDKSLTDAERARYAVLREGTKLILNSASGAGDTGHKNSIRMNNQIISMRIIGQLFSWRIGQAQTFEGARIISTNTDGLYSVLDIETNNRVLEEQKAIIRVEIEPEPLYLVTKDSNNRLELEVEEGVPVWNAKIISGSGGTLACHEGPSPRKALAHPAVIDWALARYLRYIVAGSLSIDEPLNRKAGMWLMQQAQQEKDTLLAARLFQTMVAASPGTITFPFQTNIATGTHSPLGHYTRVFAVREGTPGAVFLRNAGAPKVSALSLAARMRDGKQLAVRYDEIATPILLANGFTTDGAGGTSIVPSGRDIGVRKISGIGSDWPMLVDNRDLAELDDAQRWGEILRNLDLEVYVGMLAATFERNWMNFSDPATRAAKIAALNAQEKGNTSAGDGDEDFDEEGGEDTAVEAA